MQERSLAETRIQLPSRGCPLVIIEAPDCHDLRMIDFAMLRSLFQTHGAILLRRFGVQVETFRRFARQFCPTSVINESPGRIPIDDAHNIRSVDVGTNAFPLHPELAREPWKPDAAFFACFSAPTAGGETTICDGVELVRQMPESLRRQLEGRRLFHVMPTWPALLDFWLGTPEPTDMELASPPRSCPYSFRRMGGQIARIFSRPALHRPLFTDAPAFGNFLLFARFNNGRSDFPVLDDGQPVPEDWLQTIKATADRLSYAIRWQAGDLLMLDNSRFMHGRKAIADTAERRIATYFGYLGFAPRNPEEPHDPVWRKADFRPPAPPGL